MTFNEFSLTERELYPGEKGALTRGEDIMTDEQTAFCYVMAIDKGDKLLLPDSNTKFISHVAEKDWGAWTKIKPVSLTRKISKIKTLLGHKTGETQIDNKTKDDFKKFENMKESDIFTLATLALESPDDEAFLTYGKKAPKFNAIDIQNCGKGIGEYMKVFKNGTPNEKVKKAKQLFIEKNTNNKTYKHLFFNKEEALPKEEIAKLVDTMWSQYQKKLIN